MVVRRPPRLRTSVLTALVAAASAWLGRVGRPARARPPSQGEEEHNAAIRKIELEGRQFELAARRRAFQVAIFWLCVFLTIAVVLIGITVWCYLDGSHTTIPLVTGPTGVITILISLLFGRRAKAAPPRQ